MGDEEKPKGSEIPPKEHVRLHQEEVHPDSLIVEKDTPESPSDDSGNGDE